MFLENNELIHKCIINNLAIRTLERDRNYISDMKMQSAFEIWFDKKIKELQQELKEVKSQLLKSGIKIQSETKVDQLITEYVIIDRGNIYTQRYMNIALRNWVEEEIKRLLGLEYRTFSGNSHE
ncbi:hypothetical protein U5N28_12380 [Lysinibacillus telephonicus]|uniref:Uncharacterized protein n=2 Tax=Lysinibacillus telephonicus TaxID=1714840 RepID=A0A431UF74_9BACI|nr:hypothetical protein EKG35_18305 [Lysinibacillus telephonicus]